MQLEKALKQLPQSAGVYQYFDKDQKLLYVGKAKNLSKRVRSYFSFTPTLRPNPKNSIRITKMIEQAEFLEYIVVNSEHDALILENSLIKQLNPKYNILLRDDKTYPYIFIDNSQPYPRVEITRKVLPSKNITYFGPYSVGAKDIVDSVYELCKLVQKKSCLKSKQACLYYQIDKCFAPCELHVEKNVYEKELNKAIKLIKNKKNLIKELEKKMLFYAQNLRFEEAKELRDRIEKISKSQLHTEIDLATKENLDIFVLHHEQNRAVVVKMFLRDGKIISSSHTFLHLHNGFDEDEIYKRAIVEFYKNTQPPITPTILTEKKFEDIEAVTEYVSEIFNKKITITTPSRGKKKQLIELAKLNAKELLKKDKKSNFMQTQKDVKELFKLEKLPNRVEVFDNSHMFGVATVGAMAVWENGSFIKKDYRTYHLHARDEYSQMKELLSRRVESFSKNPPPDLWVLDGGDTLLKLAIDILSSNGVSLDVIAISKEKIDAKAHRAKGKANDIIYTKDEVFKLLNSDKRLQWVQNLRDEAHKTAINFHKKTKLKLDNESKLLTLHGISEAKVKKLLNHFGTFEAIREASCEQIGDILNIKDAKTVKKFYS